MRALVILSVASVALAAAPAGRADEATLADGRKVAGALALDEDGRLRFTGADRSAVALDRIQQVRPPAATAATAATFRAGVVHHVLLPGGQRISGELLGLDDKALRLRTPWRGRLAVPRTDLAGVTILPGTLILCDEDFEGGLKAWKVTGAPRVTDKRHTSGDHALLLDAAGQSAVYALAEPVEAGSFGVNFDVPDGAAGARWLVEAEFRGPDGPKVVRVAVAGEADVYSVEAPPRDGGGKVARKPGWHRLGVDFAAKSLLVTVDDAVLWYSRDQGPGGPLRAVRLTCVAGTGAVRGSVAFDEFTVARAAEVLKRPADTSEQDEVWQASGDQLFGRLTRLDRRGVGLKGRFGERTFPWADVRGAFPHRPAAPARTSEGAHVRLWLRPAAGSEPDELEGVLRALDGRKLTLRHPALGDLEIDRARLLRLKPLFHGKRIELGGGPRHVGERDRLAAGVQPARAEGPQVEYTIRLEARPEAARLVLMVQPVDGHADLIVNGRNVEDLGKAAGRGAREPVRVVVPLPRDVLKAGENVVEVRARSDKGRRGSVVVSEVALEVPE